MQQRQQLAGIGGGGAGDLIGFPRGGFGPAARDGVARGCRERTR